MTGDIYIDFQTSHFADFEQFKVDIYFANFGQVKLGPTWPFLLTLDIQVTVILLVWGRHASKIDSNPLCLIKIQEPGA